MADDLAGLASTLMSDRTSKTVSQPRQSKKRRKTKGHICTLSEAAEIDFEPAVFGPAHEREEFFKRNLVDLRIAIAVLGRTKAELVEVWQDEEQADLFMKCHSDLAEAAKWFRLCAEFIDKAALRLMVSGAAAHDLH